VQGSRLNEYEFLIPLSKSFIPLKKVLRTDSFIPLSESEDRLDFQNVDVSKMELEEFEKRRLKAYLLR